MVTSWFRQPQECGPYEQHRQSWPRRFCLRYIIDIDVGVEFMFFRSNSLAHRVKAFKAFKATRVQNGDGSNG